MLRHTTPDLPLALLAAGAALMVAACGGADTAPRSAAAQTAAPATPQSADLAQRQSAYNETYRPQLQYTPAKNWMNDPNGLVYHDGEYHLFYQYNPNGNTWGDMSWGHAVSRDLVHWTELPIALEVEKDANGGVTQMFFSGSAVVDTNNTSGFGKPGKPAMVAVFTSVYPQTMTLANGKAVQAGTQAQSLAYSTDRGRTWTQYAGNPVIAEPPPPYQGEFREFRDPKVFWYEPQQKWVMVAVLAQKRKAVLYESKNLKDWAYMSEFGPANAVGGVWECPDLFELAVDGDKDKKKWVLVINLNPGAVAGGSGAQYFTGSFDGKTFRADNVHDAAPPPGTVLADFESAGTFEQLGWTATGDFIGAGPAAGTLPGQQQVSDYAGSRLVNTFIDHDQSVGTITSPTFKVSSRYVNLLVGGGRHPYNPDAGDGSDPVGELLFPGADFEGPDGQTYADLGWTPTGAFVGQGPARGGPGDPGYVGDKYVQSCLEGCDAATGTLTSPDFVITKPYINFVIGSGNHPYPDQPTAVVLWVDGQVVRTATGKNDPMMDWIAWDVSALIGKTAKVQIIDESTGGWGHISVDHLIQSSQPAKPRPIATAVSLLVDGKVVRSATGDNSEQLHWTAWNVGEFIGRDAQLQIVDQNRGGWGHILVDQITFSSERKDIANWVDWGSDFYAAVSWNNVPGGKRVWTGWMSNWDYAGSTPTSPWRSAQTFVRELSLATVDGQARLVQTPVESLRELRRDPVIEARGRAVPAGVTALPLRRGGVPLEIEAELEPDGAGKFGFKVLTGANGDETIVGYDVAAGEVYIDRSKSGDASFSSTFATRHAAPLALRDGKVRLHIVVDRSSVTVFAGDRDVVLTDQVFPDPSSNGLALFAEGGRAQLKTLTVWPLKSIWAGR